MTSNSSRCLAATALAATLAGCGGGGGGGVNSIVAPAPAPAPTPPPDPTPTPTYPTVADAMNLFPSVTANAELAVTGYELNTRYGNSALTGDGFSVSYDAASRTYRIDVPYENAGSYFYYDGPKSSSSWHTYCTVCTNAILDIRGPTTLDPALEYVTVASYYDYDWGGSEPLGYFAFGVATPTGAVPVTGSASYKASVFGETFDGANRIEGTAAMQFDFAAGSLSGTLNPVLVSYLSSGNVRNDLPAYTFVNTIFGVGSATWSGELATAGAASNGSFDGRFMGPTATELMARFRAPYYNPVRQQWSTMFGVWAGKKQ